jgi:SAM-dependent methyltransferase
LLASARVAPADHVLDVGCGCGESTRDAARAARDGRALGVDLSARMLDRAQERAAAEGLTNVEFVQADAQVHPFPGEAFDLAMSRFGAMFFGDPVAAYTNIARALRPQGRLALLVWQSLAENEWLQVLRAALAAGRDLPVPPTGAPGPFGLADPDTDRRILGAAGFADVAFEDVREPVWIGRDAADAFAFAREIGMARALVRDLDGATVARALGALADALASHETPDGVLLDSAAWLVTARRA